MLSTTYRALNLREFRYALTKVDSDSIYHHFWGRLLQPSFDEPEFSNDFAAWARHGLHDLTLAERLSVINPVEFSDVEGLRNEVIETVEWRLDESELITWAVADQQFYFLKSKLIVLDTALHAATPAELGQALEKTPLGAVYFHFIDSRHRNKSGDDDFTIWLNNQDEDFSEMVNQIKSVDPFFSCLETIRHKLIAILKGAKVGDNS